MNDRIFQTLGGPRHSYLIHMLNMSAYYKCGGNKGDPTIDDVIECIATRHSTIDYCEICLATDKNFVVDHSHDIIVPGRFNHSKDKYVGEYRAKLCTRCNILESHAKKMKCKYDYVNYFFDKIGCTDWYGLCERLERLEYIH